ncbi:MAG: TMEM165/GDT1 family protein, partial [Cyanobacteria bacterium P01_A01_bin.80]
MSGNTEPSILNLDNSSASEVKLQNMENINNVEISESVTDEAAIAQTEQVDDLKTGSVKKPQSVLMVFASTFITIFLAEIGDKTQLSTLMMSAESHSPWIVFLGSGTALISTSLLGVLLGSQMAKRLSPKTVE